MTTMVRHCSVLAIAVLVSTTMSSTIAGQGAAPQGRGGNAAPAPPAAQPGHGMGKLVLWGDTSDFSRPGPPVRCYTTSRFTRGQRAGFRMTAIDGGTGETEHTAEMVVHVTFAGKTFDLPMQWRGVGFFPPKEYPRQPTEMWTAAWEIPKDAPLGQVKYTVTAKDRFGRTATFTPFPNLTNQFTIVE